MNKKKPLFFYNSEPIKNYENSPQFINTITNFPISRINEASLDNIFMDSINELCSIRDDEKGIHIVTQFNMMSFSESSRRLLQQILVIFNKGDRNYPDGNFTLKEYMEISRFKSEREAITQLNIDLNILQNTSVTLKRIAKDKDNKPWKDKWINKKLELFATTSFINGVIHFEFHESFFKTLQDWMTYIPIDIRLFKLSLKYNIAYYIGNRLYNHAKMRAGKPNEKYIPVQSLIDACPTLPRKGGVTYGKTKEIIRPIEKNLEILHKNGILKGDYEFCNYSDKKEHPLTAKELAMQYITTVNIYLRFELEDYEEQRQKILESKNNNIKTNAQINTKIQKLTKRVARVEKKSKA